MAQLLRIFALGGNEVSPTGHVDPVTGQMNNPDVGEQWRRAAETCCLLADIIAADQESLYILTHGNGPQVGNILLRSEYSAPILHTLPLDICDADAQGAMGYMLAQLSNALKMKGIDRIAAETVTQVVVDRNDPAFKEPTKFIGPAYSKEDAMLKAEEKDHFFKAYKKNEDGVEVWRRVVPSPDPVDIVEISVIEADLDTGIIPIAVGGGGIPVIRIEPAIEGDEEVYHCRYGIRYRRKVHPDNKPVGIFSGVEAVIDKDLASALLGSMLIERAKKRGESLQTELTIFTDVDGVKLNFQQPNEETLRSLSLEETKALYDQGIFPAGSMGPKIRAAINFIEGGGRKVYITRVDLFLKTLEGKAGTTITP